MITNILYLILINFLKILPILIVAIVASQIITSYVSKEKIKNTFRENEKNIVKASIAGIATPGPLLVFLPILKTLKKKGLPISIIVAFITGQSLIGPARLFLEVGYFGIMFFVYRVIISFFIAIGIATCFRLLERYTNF